ncbi:MAG: ABC transporter substrate-binding protein [Bacillota bacterium]
MNKRTIASLITLLLALLLLVSACAPAAAPAASPSAEPTAAPTVVVTEPTAAPERTITDMAGRTVVLPEKIEKIGTFGSIGVLNAFVELMGQGSKICNEMSANFTKTDKWAMQYEFAPQIKGAPVFEEANEIVIETVLQTKPDVCFTMTKESAEYLAENGLAAVYLSWTKPEDVKTAVTLMGEIFGVQDIAADYIAYFDQKVAEAASLLAGVSEQKAVLYGSVTELKQPHIIAEWWIKQAGGISVTDNGRTDESLTYTVEDLLKWNPDVMFLSANQIEDIKKDDKLKDITAVKNGAMYVVPTVAHVWGNRTVEQPLTIFWAMNKLYPDVVTADRLKEEIKYFYSHFFLYEMSDEQIAKIIG